MDVSYESYASLLMPIPSNVTIIGEAIGHQVYGQPNWSFLILISSMYVLYFYFIFFIFLKNSLLIIRTYSI